MEQCTEPRRSQQGAWGHVASRKNGQLEVKLPDDKGAETIFQHGGWGLQATGYGPRMRYATSIPADRNNVPTVSHNIVPASWGRGRL